ncbi:DUF2510 domain-containing protein [Antrihabitans spumae]|uniref:DUF2510 domain-containing protein n=1 Tax=Antrihabitans spumae TaxID=3373370 RepID=A0ABW7K5J8_9NOCA
MVNSPSRQQARGPESRSTRPEPVHLAQAAPISQGPPPGWYPEPQGSGGKRWWDSTTWTDHRQPEA